MNKMKKLSRKTNRRRKLFRKKNNKMKKRETYDK